MIKPEELDIEKISFQYAEEAGESITALSKLLRFYDGENVGSYTKLVENVIEELADVYCCARVILEKIGTLEGYNAFNLFEVGAADKYNRWCRRLNGADGD